ncbi:uncharacterized protein LOC123689535 [Pieris rapae]|uniref:uncharacterized protein LOC123689535 n=1 Tax=Pieris rapae TaxID=64459 RepID=UPI001E27D966|nr:uncharacterized protein LOC123689535 [Pieris rapae]
MVGRSRKNKLSNPKVAKQINDNLLKISIRTENYIYNDEPMTISEAKEMKYELSTYKKLTKKDVRTLQIIEKQNRLLQGIIREEENVLNGIVCHDDNQLNDNVDDEDIHISVATNTVEKVESKRSSDIHINTSIAGSPTFNLDHTQLIGTSNTFEATNSPTINLSSAVVNTLTRSDNIKTVDNTPETISLPSQDDSNNKQLDVDISLVKQNTNIEQSHHLPKKRRNNAKNLSWIDNMKYVRVVEDDEFDPKLSNLGKFWDNFQLPQDWDENDFCFE